MTNKQAIKWLKDYIQNTPFQMEQYEKAFEMAIKALSQEPCTDAVSREAVLDTTICEGISCNECSFNEIDGESGCLLHARIDDLPSVTQKSGKCKNCKYFEYDSVAKVDGIPLIVAHEICNKWGNGCKTREDGYCFMFEPQESEDKE